MLLINLISILSPQFIRWSIDVGIYGGDLALLGWAVLLLALILVKGIFILADNLNCLELFREIW